MLETENVSVFYGSHRALEGASITVNQNEIVVMLGSNGAGKSTFLQAIAGLTAVAEGSTIKMDGFDITGKPPDDIVEAGIALVPEDRGIFADLTVRENLVLGAYPKRARPHQSKNLDRVLTLFPKLAERQNQSVRTMSGGERQMVAIGRAMMSHPSILMLDEPSLGLSPLLCTELFQSLKDVKETGVGIFLVEQNARQSLALADRGYLLDNGQITGADTAEALSQDEAVINAYLGGKKPGIKTLDLQLPATPPLSSSDTPVLSENPYAIKAGQRANIRNRIEDILSLSISELVDRATLTQVEHVGEMRSETEFTRRPDLEVAASGNGLNGGLDVANKKLGEVEETKMDDLQKMLLQMEEAAASALSSGKDSKRA